MTSTSYPGRELELFAGAHRWKRYLAEEMAPFIGRRTLEVGAGIGGTTLPLARATKQKAAVWVCLEPDPALARELRASIDRGVLPAACEVRCGDIRSVAERESYDTILYVDVLEHILDDRAELLRAASHLSAGGYLVVLSPAHRWLYSEFDSAVGHHRRYTRRSLRDVVPRELEQTRLRYLDSCGLLASLANRLLLKQALPSEREIAAWDRFLVGPSTWIDRLTGHRVGKSLLGVWRRRS